MSCLQCPVDDVNLELDCDICPEIKMWGHQPLSLWVDQLARGRRRKNGNQEKTGGSDSTDQMSIPWCAQEGLLEHPKVNIISFLTPSLPAYSRDLCFWRWGGLGKGVSSSSSPCILWAVFEGSWCFSSSEQGDFISLSSFRLFVQFCLPEPVGGDF